MPEEREILRAGEYFLAVEGLAMIRSVVLRPSLARERVPEIRTIIERFDEFPQTLEFPVSQHDVESGYGQWAPNYDSPNLAIDAEEPVVKQLLSTIKPGRALDAACGTGRHAQTLAALGHSVIGVDTSEAMLAVAREKLRGADLRAGRLDALPVDDASIDVLTCALALEHVEVLEPVFAEFARVLRAGGEAIISDMHPVWRTSGGAAIFPTADGKPGLPHVVGYTHQVSEYARAFLAEGFTLLGCYEPLVSEETVTRYASFTSYPEATRQAFLGMPLVIIWHLRR
jgi:ubiquinone/menaquinone biosynthesis C-methylase UbiE